MLEVIRTALMITAFVSVMMLLVEYLHIVTGGAWQERLARRRWGQYLLAAALGVTPGCLGAFAAVAMYSHGALTLGAIVTAMITTSGDEAFVMLALVPKQATAVFLILFVTGIAVGALVDVTIGRRHTLTTNDCLKLHPSDQPSEFLAGSAWRQWKHWSAARGVMTVGLVLFIVFVVTGDVGPAEWNWIRGSLVAVTLIALFVVGSVSEHFLEEHLWRHVIVKHAPPVFLWTLGALTILHFMAKTPHLEDVLRGQQWGMLAAACLLGLIPESGPHLVFVMLYAEGVAPLSILLASSIVQDGHGMLPMLAHSRRDFVVVKAINFAVGLMVGAVGLIIES